MVAMIEQRWISGWVATVMHSFQNAYKERRKHRVKPIAELEFRLSDHMLRDIGMTTDKVKSALVSQHILF